MIRLQKTERTASGATIEWRVDSIDDIKRGIRSGAAVAVPMTEDEAGMFRYMLQTGRGGVEPLNIYRVVIEPEEATK